MGKNKVKKAMDILRKAMKKDPAYAYGWHCNIARMMQDAGASHEIANDGAARFMKLAFDVDTTKEPKAEVTEDD